MLERGSDDGARLDFIEKFLQTYGNADQFEALNYLGSKVRSHSGCAVASEKTLMVCISCAV